MVRWVCDKLWWLFVGRRRLRVEVHKAYFLGNAEECIFVTVTNLSRERELVITHVFFECEPQVHVLRPERLLPKRLKPEEPWETWIKTAALPAQERERAHLLARVRLSNGRVVKSKAAKNVPSVGAVPGGPISRP